MAKWKATNNARSVLVNDITASDDTFEVAAGELFPEDMFIVSIGDEILEVGLRTGNVFSDVVRGMEGTVATNHSANSIISCRLTAGMYEELLSKSELRDQKGEPGGVASLDATGNVPLEQLGNAPDPDLSGYATRIELDAHKAETVTEIINVKTGFGAVGDGVTDDTQAIQDAMDAYTSGVIYFPPGDYISSAIRYPSNVVIIGAGKEHTRIIHAAEVTTVLLARKESVKSNIYIQGITFDGNKDNQINQLRIGALDVLNVVIKECDFISIGNHLEISINGDKSVVENCSFWDIAEHSEIETGTNTRALLIRGEGNMKISSCMFKAEQPSEAGKAPGGIYASGTMPSLIIENCVFDGMGQNYGGNLIGCIDLYQSSHRTIIRNNKFYNYRYRPLKLQNAGEVICEGNIIVGRAIDGANIAAINYEPATREQTPAFYNCIIANNIIKDIDGSVGIIVQGGPSDPTTNVIVSNNILEGTTGLRVYNINGFVIVDNLVYDAPGESSEDVVILENIVGTVIIDKMVSTGGRIGVMARTGLADADILLVNSSIKNINGAYTVSFRDCRNVTLDNCILDSGTASVFDNTYIERFVLKGNKVPDGATLKLSSTPDQVFIFGNSWQPDMSYSSSAPTSGTFKRGDIVFNDTPSAGGKVGWICVSGGTFGGTDPVFKPFGAIDS